MQEIQLILESKANSVEFEILSNVKVGIEDIQRIDKKLNEIELKIQEEKKNREIEMSYSKLFQVNSNGKYY